MAAANKVTIIPCGAMTADLTWHRSVEKLRGIQERTGAQLVFGHDADQIHQLRVGPKESCT